MILSKTKF